MLPYIVQQNRNIVRANKDEDLYKVEVENFMQGVYQKESQADHSWDDNTKRTNGTRGNSRKRFTPFPFDPNTAPKNEWVKMGFTERQADVILKYRKRGGHFYRKEDFSKLYVVDDETYNIFEPYILIGDCSRGKYESGKQNDEAFKTNYSTSNTNYSTSKKSYSTSIKSNYRDEGLNIELNGADSLELLRINGVGPVFASRIMKYRQRLGGFATIGQLKEVYGMDSVRFAGIAGQISADTSLITGMDINKVSLAELRRHPYLDYYGAKAIIDKRVQLGGYKTFREIEAALSVKPGVYKRIKPYIRLHL